MPKTLAQAAQFVDEVFRQHGVRLPPQSRISQIISVLRGDGIVYPDDGLFPAAQEGFRDVRVLDFALSQLNGVMDCSILRNMLGRILKDHLLPQDDIANSPGRDTQTELYVAGIANKAKMTPRFAEPDILCDVDGKAFGIAVKRIKREERFEEHFRKAVSQIEKSGVPGVIVADMSMAFNRSNQKVTSPATEEQMMFVHRLTKKPFVDTYYNRMKSWIGGREVRGLIIMESILRCEPSSGWFLEYFYYDVTFNLHNRARHQEWRRFGDVFMSGYPTPAIKGLRDGEPYGGHNVI